VAAAAGTEKTGVPFAAKKFGGCGLEETFNEP
jgi:hypothetical protein